MSNSSIGVDVRNSLRADQLGISVHFVNLVRYHRAIGAVKRSGITGLKRFRINRMDENQRANRVFRLHGSGQHRIRCISKEARNQRDNDECNKRSCKQSP